MPTVTLTDISVRNLKPVPGKRVTHLDKSVSGFGVRVTENRIKTFVLTYGEDRNRPYKGGDGNNIVGDAANFGATVCGLITN